jgi:hypothetical protein
VTPKPTDMAIFTKRELRLQCPDIQGSLNGYNASCQAAHMLQSRSA